MPNPFDKHAQAYEDGIKAPTIAGDKLSPTQMLYFRQLAEQHANQGGACPVCGQQAATSPKVEIDPADAQRLASK